MIRRVLAKFMAGKTISAYTEDLKEVTEAITRTLLNVQYKIARRQVLQEMNAEHLGGLETEDDILAAAVTLTDNG